MASPAPARATALRVTRTDACGVPVAEATANSRLTTAAFVQVGMSQDVFNSQDIQVVGASGAICVRSKGQPTLLGVDVTLQLCNFNETLLEMLLGSAILVDGADNVGGVIQADGSVNTNTVMLEWWSENVNNDSCSAATPRPYVHSILPRVNRFVLSGQTDFGDTPTTFTLQAYAEPTTAMAASRAADEWAAADITAINQSGLYAWREVTAVPTTVANGYDP